MSAEDPEQDPDLLLAIALSKSLEEHANGEPSSSGANESEAMDGAPDESALPTTSEPTQTKKRKASLGSRQNSQTLAVPSAPGLSPQALEAKKEFEELVQRVSSQCSKSPVNSQTLMDDSITLFTKLRKLELTQLDHFLFFSAIIYSLANAKLNSEMAASLDHKKSYHLAILLMKTSLHWLPQVSSWSVGEAESSKEPLKMKIIKILQLLFLSLGGLSGFENRKWTLPVAEKKQEILSKPPSFEDVAFEDQKSPAYRPSPETRSLSLTEIKVTNPPRPVSGLAYLVFKSFDEGNMSSRAQFQNLYDLPLPGTTEDSAAADASMSTKDGNSDEQEYQSLDFHANLEATPSKSGVTLLSICSNEIRINLGHLLYQSKISQLLGHITSSIKETKEFEMIAHSLKFAHVITSFLCWFDTTHQDSKAVEKLLEFVSALFDALDSPLFLEETGLLNEIVLSTSNLVNEMTRYFGRFPYSAVIVPNFRVWIYAKIVESIDTINQPANEASSSKCPSLSKFLSFSPKLQMLPLAYEQFRSLKTFNSATSSVSLPKELFKLATKDFSFDACQPIPKRQLLTHMFAKTLQRIISLFLSIFSEAQPAAPETAASPEPMSEDSLRAYDAEDTEFLGTLFNEGDARALLTEEKKSFTLTPILEKVLVGSLQFVESILQETSLFLKEKISPKVFFGLSESTLYVTLLSKLQTASPNWTSLYHAITSLGTKLITNSWIHPTILGELLQALHSPSQNLWVPTRETLSFVIKLYMYQVATDCPGLELSTNTILSTIHAVYSGKSEYSFHQSVKYDLMVLSCFLYGVAPLEQKSRLFNSLLGYLKAAESAELRYHILLLVEYMTQNHDEMNPGLGDYLKAFMEPKKENESSAQSESPLPLSQYYLKFAGLELKSKFIQLPSNNVKKATQISFSSLVGVGDEIQTFIHLLDLSSDEGVSASKTEDYVQIDLVYSTFQRLVSPVSLPLEVIVKHLDTIGSKSLGIHFLLATLSNISIKTAPEDVDRYTKIIDFVARKLTDIVSKSEDRLHKRVFPLYTSAIATFSFLIRTLSPKPVKENEMETEAPESPLLRHAFLRTSELVLVFVENLISTLKTSLVGILNLSPSDAAIVRILCEAGLPFDSLISVLKNLKCASEGVTSFENVFKNGLSRALLSKLASLPSETTQEAFKNMLLEVSLLLGVSDPLLAQSTIPLVLKLEILEFSVDFIAGNLHNFEKYVGDKLDRQYFGLALELCLNSAFAKFKGASTILHKAIADPVAESFVQDSVKLSCLEKLLDAIPAPGTIEGESTVTDEAFNARVKNVLPGISYLLQTLEGLFEENQRIFTLSSFFLHIKDGIPAYLESKIGVLVPVSSNPIALLGFMTRSNSKNITLQTLRIFTNLLSLEPFPTGAGQLVSFEDVFCAHLSKTEPVFMEHLLARNLFTKISPDGKEPALRDLSNRFTKLVCQLKRPSSKAVADKFYGHLVHLLPFVVSESPEFVSDYIKVLSESADTNERVATVLVQLESLAASLDASLDTLSEESLLCIDKLISLFTLSEADVENKAMDVDSALESAPLCTFVKTGKTHEEQHWYHCYTCKLTGNEGCCSSCARGCHSGHDLSYSKFGKFYCDCGSNPQRRCKKLKVESEAEDKFVLPPTLDQYKLQRGSDGAEGIQKQRISLPIKIYEADPIRCCLILTKMSQTIALKTSTVGLSTDSGITVAIGSQHAKMDSCEIFEKKKGYKAGAFDLKISSDSKEGKLIKSLVTEKHVARGLLSASGDRLLVAEHMHLSSFDISPLFSDTSSGSIEKSSATAIVKQPCKFDIVHLAVNPRNQNHIAVAGVFECMVLVQDQARDTYKTINIQLGGEQSEEEYISNLFWFPWSQSHLVIVMPQNIRVYNLAQDSFSPELNFNLMDDEIASATIVKPRSTGTPYFVIIGKSSMVYTQSINGFENAGPVIVSSTLVFAAVPDVPLNPTAVYYSALLDVLLLSNDDGTVFVCKIDDVSQEITGVTTIAAGAGLPIRENPPKRFYEHPNIPGVVLFTAAKYGMVHMLKFDGDRITHSTVKPFVSSGSVSIEGLCFMQNPVNKANLSLIALHEDGSLARHDTSSRGSELLDTSVKSKETKATKHTFPVNFFEDKIDISKKISFGAELGKYFSGEAAIEKWIASEDVATVSGADPIVVQISDTEVVPRGFRVLLNPSAKKHHPSEIRFLNQTVRTKDVCKRWYEFPFTLEESKQIAKAGFFSFNLGRASDKPGCSGIRVYASTKSDFAKEASSVAVEADAKSQRPLILESSWARAPKLAKEKIISSCLSGLKNLLTKEDAQPSQSSAVIKDTLKTSIISLIPALNSLLSAPSLLHDANVVLSKIITDREEFFKTRDLLFLDSLRTKLMSSSEGHLSISHLVQAFENMIDIVTYSPSTFHNFIKSESTISSRLWKLFQSSVDEDLCESPHLSVIIQGTVLILVAQISLASNSQETVQECIKNIISLVSSPIEAIRVYSTSAIINYFSIFHKASSDSVGATSAFYQYYCDGCKRTPIANARWHCQVCEDFDMCEECHQNLTDFTGTKHRSDHTMERYPIDDAPMDTATPSQATESSVEPSSESMMDAELQEAIRMSLGGSEEGSPNPIQQFVDLLLESFKEKRTKGGLYTLPYLQILLSLITSGKLGFESIKKCITTVCPSPSSPVFSPLPSRNALLECDLVSLQFLQQIPVRERKSTEALDSIASPVPQTLSLQNTGEVASLILQQNLGPLIVGSLQRLTLFYSSMKQSTAASGVESAAAQSDSELLVPQYSFKRTYEPFLTEVALSASSDPFSDFRKMLLEIFVKFYYNIIRAKKTVEDAYLDDENLPTFVALLCQLIALPQTFFIKNLAKKVIRAIYKSKEKYYEVRDCGVMRFYLSQIKEIAPQLEAGGMYSLSFEDSHRLLYAINQLLKVAQSRPRNWKLICHQDASVVTFLFHISEFMVEESILGVLKLLLEAFAGSPEVAAAEETQKNSTTASSSQAPSNPSQDAASKTNEAGTAEEKNPSDAKSSKKKEVVADPAVLWSIPDSQLSRFIDSYLLGINIAAVRSETRKLVLAIFTQYPEKQKDLLSVLTSKLSAMPSYGKNAADYFDCYDKILASFGDKDTKVIGDVVDSLKSILREQNTLLVNHPNSFMYKALAQYIDVDGFYLESDPCLVCNDPEVPFQSIRVDGIKSEVKFLHNSQIIKFNGSYVLRAVSLNVSSESRRSKGVKLVSIFYSTSTADMAELKNNHALWKRGAPIHVEQGKTEAKAEFPIPIVASNIKLEFTEFYESSSTAFEKIQCPRCSTTVTEKHGICRGCGENAYQCRQCRAIHYEDLRAFLCVDCGFCRYGKFDFSFHVKRNLGADRIFSAEDRKLCLDNIEKETKNAHKSYQQLVNFKKPLQKIVHRILDQDDDSSREVSEIISAAASRGASSGSGNKVNQKIQALGSLYHRDCKPNFEALSRSVQMLTSFRRELLRYSQSQGGGFQGASSSSSERPSGKCFGCAIHFITRSLKLFESISKNSVIRDDLIQKGVLEELLTVTLHQGTKQTRADTRSVIASLIKDNQEATKQVNHILKEKILGCILDTRNTESVWHISNEVHLLSELCMIEDSVWESRLKLIIEIFFSAISKGHLSPLVTEAITLPCLRVISKLCVISTSQKFPIEVEKALDRRPKLSYSEWKEGGPRFAEWSSNLFTESKEIKQPTTTDKKTDVVMDPSLRYMVRKCARVWKQKTGLLKEEPTMPAFIQGSWIRKLLLNPVSQLVRQETKSLVETLYQGSAIRKLRFVDLLTSMLEYTSQAGEASSEFFELYNQLLNEEYRAYLIIKGIIPQLLTAIGIETNRISFLENSFSTDMSQGFVLKNLVQLMNLFVENPLALSKFKQGKLLEIVLDSYLHLRGLVVQKTKLTDDASDLLLKLLKKCFGDSEEDKTRYMTTCSSALDKHSKGSTGLFILEQMSITIRPVKVEPVYMLVLNKASSQEEFIPGSMNRNPYSSKDVGPLMRNVKNKICVDLGMGSFLDSDNGIELLVDNKIINLGLSIKLVYEKVWLPSRPEKDRSTLPPMVVVYRLQGLEGEARETIVETIDEEQDAERDPEEEFAITSVLRETNGIQFLLTWLKQVNNFELHRETVTLLLTILYYCGKLKQNRVAMLKLGAVSILFIKLEQVFQSDSISALSQNIIELISVLVAEANSVRKSEDEMRDEEQIATDLTHLPMFLEKLKSPILHGNSKITNVLSRVLPFLTYGNEELFKIFADFFEPYLNFDELDKSQTADSMKLYYLNALKTALSMIPVNHNGNLMREYFLRRGITQKIADYLLQCFPPNLDKKSTQWTESLQKHSVTLLLEYLSGLARSHGPSQTLLVSSGIVKVLCHLETIPSGKNIGALSGVCLTAICEGNEGAAAEVKKEQTDMKADRKKKAIGKRQQALQSISSATMAAEEMEEEKGHQCAVCLEGYTLQKQQPLGFYTYSKRVQISGQLHSGAGIPPVKAKQESGFCTVTYFKVIHYKCHEDDTRVKKSGRNAMDEWGGAALRNSGSPCNSIFPIRGPEIPTEVYAREVERYWQYLNGIYRAPSANRIRFLLHDLRLLLVRLANKESFSTDSLGGSESNLSMVPHMIYMALFLMDQPPTPRTSFQTALNQFTAAATATWRESGLLVDNASYMLVATLLLYTPSDWEQNRYTLFKQLILARLLEPLDPALSINQRLRPSLVFFAIVNELHNVLKKGLPKGSINDTDATTPWVVEFKQRLVAGEQETQERLKGFLKMMEEEVFVLEELSEFIDVLQLQPLLMSEGIDEGQLVESLTALATPPS